MLAEEEMPWTLKLQKTEPVLDVPTSVSKKLTSATDGDLPTSMMIGAQGSHPRNMWELPVVHASSMQLLTVEQALAAAASGSAVVHAICTRQQ